MNLTVIENRAIAALPVAYQQLVSVRFKKPIRDYDGYELEKSLKDIIQKAFAEMGHMNQAQDDKVITFLRETLAKDLKRPKLNGLSLESVHLFISNGIRGQYGTFKNQLNALNVQNIHYWIMKGQESEEWKQSLKEFDRLYLEANTSDVPIQVKIQRSIEGVISAFDHYRAGEDSGGKHIHRLPFCGFAYYDVLNELIGSEYKGFKTLVTDPVARKELHKRSVEAYKKELAVKKSRARFQGKDDLVEGIEGMLKNLQGNKTLENRTKEIMLIWYFDSLIKEGKDIRDVLKEVA